MSATAGATASSASKSSATMRSAACIRSRRSLLEPGLQVLVGEDAVALRRLRQRSGVHLLDPVRRIVAVVGQHQPEQPQPGLAREALALEQEAAELGLCRPVILAGGCVEPTRGLHDVLALPG